MHTAYLLDQADGSKVMKLGSELRSGKA